MKQSLRTDATTASFKPMAYRVAHVVVPVASILFVLSHVDGAEVWAALRGMQAGLMLAAVVACSLQIVLSALRWRLTASLLGAAMTRRSAVSEYYLSSFINMTLPGGVLGDATRALRARTTAGLETAAQAVVIERFAGQIALGTVLLLGLAVSGRSVLQTSAWIAAGVIAILLLLLRAARRAEITGRAPAFLRRFGLAIGRSWAWGRGFAAQAVLSLAIVVVNLVAFACAARAVGAEIGFPAILYAVPLILLAMLIPFSIGGWGYREGAAAAIFPLIGQSAAMGVSASVAFGAAILLASLPGAFLILRPAHRPGPASSMPAERASK
ncbi:lysylphosphatidylglycerol synthase transmembrane domain-containing protein [Yoonia sp.]|uniref:lysylphosphatidylglycerol synthase transmembrane domain-containing protein n=1 Tax=Yoonia sp. TaxID=2212373 RepID=UPI002FD9F82F